MKNFKCNIFLGSFFIACLSLAACKTISTKAPENEVEYFAFKPELSEFIVPFSISNKGLENVINSNIKGLLYEDSDLEDDNISVKVWKEAPITVSAAGNIITYRLPLKISLKSRLRFESLGLDFGESKETQFAIALKFKSRINIDNNWNLKTVTEANGFEWLEKPSLNLAGIPVPVAPFADKLIKDQMGALALLIDEQTGKNLDVKNELNKFWEMIQEPFLLSDAPETWLKIVPVSVSLSPIKGSNEKISALLGVKAYTETILGPKPVSNSILAMPNLEFGNYKGGFFNISLLTDISYENATNLASKALVGKIFKFGKKGKKKLQINDVFVYPNKARLIVRLGVEGSIKGNIFFSGVPHFQADSQKLVLKDFDFDIDTKNKLMKSANWLAHGMFVKKLQPYFEYDLGPQLQESRNVIQGWLANKELSENVFLNGDIDQLYPQKIFLTKNAIKAVISGNGRAEVSIRSF